MTPEPIGKKVDRTYSGSLAETYSQIAAPWHRERNGTLTPDQVLFSPSHGQVANCSK